MGGREHENERGAYRGKQERRNGELRRAWGLGLGNGMKVPFPFSLKVPRATEPPTPTLSGGAC